jgi:hypothetical protein
MVGASFTVAAVAEVLRSKKGITAVGNAQVDTAQSKFGGASALFDGTGDYLSIAHHSSLSLADYSDWTIECWSRLTEGTARTILNKDGVAGSLYPGYTFYTNSSKQVIFGVGGSAGNWITVTRSTALADNTWYHLAAVKSGSTVTFYVDGTSAGTATWVGYADQSRALFIGYEQDGTFMYGHLDEIRISNTARYTTTFTPSTTAFVNDANTLFLMHANGTDASTFFEDDNGVRQQKGITAVGNAQVDTAQSKFGGASALFDGTGDYLEIYNATPIGTETFTIDYWVRAASTASTPTLVDLRSGAGDTTGYSDYINSNGKLVVFMNNSDRITSTTTINTNTWYHIAIVRDSSNNIKLYINGTNEGSSYNFSNNMTSSYYRIGNNIIAANGLNGHIDEIRISNSARYTTTFTPSTTPFVNDANTLLLIHADGTDASTVFRDDNGARAQKGISAIGNAQVDTAQSKFGGASALFDGTGDYLTVGNTVDSDLALAGTTWTVEYWARINSHTGSFNNTIGIWDSTTAVGAVYYFTSNAYNGTQKMGFSYVYGTNSLSGDLNFGSALSTGVWQHHAFVRNGNTLTAYLDGVSQGTHDMTGRTIDITGYNNSSTTPLKLTIGAMNDATGAYNGYLDEVRISNIARYTAAFTPSTTPFQSDANTVLLLHMDGTDASTVFTDDNGIAPYTP